jgi:hypothetical protein
MFSYWIPESKKIWFGISNEEFPSIAASHDSCLDEYQTSGVHFFRSKLCLISSWHQNKYWYLKRYPFSIIQDRPI